MRWSCRRVPGLKRCALLSAVLLTLSTLLLGYHYTTQDPRVAAWARAILSRVDTALRGPERLSAAKTPTNVTSLSQHVQANASHEQPGSRCINSGKTKIKADSHFGSVLNADVPVLIWDKHSSTAWGQLKGKRPPYGCKGLPESLVVSTLQLLNHSANRWLFDASPPRGCVRCAVVGNGGILNASRQGRAIDAHDFVFRVNGAIIKGFEQDVGHKTSFYVFTVNTMKNSLLSYKRYGFTEVPQGKDLRYIFIPSKERDYVMLKSAILGVAVPDGDDKGNKPWIYFGPAASAHKFKFLHPAFVSYVTDRFLNSDLLKKKSGSVYRPSTGALMLLTALHTCDQVSAYGFITENYSEFSDHYFDQEKKQVIFYINHDMQMEAALWKTLHQRGLLWLYQR